MMQVDPRQRGSRLLYAGRQAAQASGLTSGAGVRSTVAASRKVPAQPAFSGDFRKQMVQSTTNALVPVFQKITEVFLYGFLAQDLLSMVLPRIFKNTFRGRDQYDPSQDPQAQGQPFTKQMKLWMVNNFKGLNWEQGREEVTREMTAGPGLLLVPAFAFALIRRTFGKSAMELSKPSLDGLSEGYIEKLKAAEAKLGPTEVVDTREVLKEHIRSLFIDKRLNKQDAITPAQLEELEELKTKLKDLGWPKASSEEIQEIARRRDLLKDKRKASETVQALDQFSEEWAEIVEKHASNPKERNKALQALIDGLGEKTGADAPTWKKHGIVQQLWKFNRANRLHPYNAAEEIQGVDKLDEAARRKLGINANGMVEENLHRSDRIWSRRNGSPRLLSTKGLMADLVRFSDYVDAVHAHAGSTGAKFSDAATQVMKKLTKKKFFLGGLLSIATALYLVRVTKWAMSNSSYQANRKLQLDQPAGGAPGVGTGNVDGASDTAQSGSTPNPQPQLPYTAGYPAINLKNATPFQPVVPNFQSDTLASVNNPQALTPFQPGAQQAAAPAAFQGNARQVRLPQTGGQMR